MMQRIIRLVDHLRLFGAGLVSDPTDIVFCLALALLPAGGTVFGFSMMYWSPISPVLFVLHVLLNVRFVPRVFSRYGAIMLYPAALIVVSVYGWASIGFHVHTAFQTLVALLSGISCLISLDIAFRLKQLDLCDQTCRHRILGVFRNRCSGIPCRTRTCPRNYMDCTAHPET